MSRDFWSKFNHIVGFLLACTFLAYFGTSIVSQIIFFEDLHTSSLGLRIFGLILNSLAIIVETLGPLYAIYFMVQLIDGVLRVGEMTYDLDAIEIEPKVNVIIPIHNVNPAVLKDTLIGFEKQEYKNFDVWVGDDSSDKESKEKCEEVSNKHGAIYFYDDSTKFKAQMVNKIIPKVEGKYLVFFDVDHIPKPDILKKFVVILEQYPEYSFVQSKVSFRNATNLLHVWEAMSLAQMFCSQNARRRIGNVLFNGSTAIFRREMAETLPEGPMTEDYDHTIVLASQGYKGYWLDEVGAMSLVPETIGHQMSQLNRWMTGQAGALMDHKKVLFRSKMRPSQALDFIVSSTVVLVATSFYFLSIFYAVMYVLNISILRVVNLGAIPLVFMPIATFAVYLVTITSTTVYTAKSGTFPLKLWHVPFFLAFGSMTAPFLLIPVIKGLFGKNKIIPGKQKWNKKIPLIGLSIMFSFAGLVFTFLAFMSTMDFLNRFGIAIDSLTFLPWYNTTGLPGENYFFIIFILVGLTWLFSFPFVLSTRKIFKPKHYEEVNVYH